MKISKDKVVIMHYAVMDRQGTTIDSSYDHGALSFIQGSGFLIEGLEEALEGKQAENKFTVDVDADKAYGPRHEELVQAVDRAMFEGIDDINIGTQLRATTEDGEQSVMVIDITDESIVVDGNNPLAGVDLTFDVEILEVRDATEEELAHGHVHGEGGCGH